MYSDESRTRAILDELGDSQAPPLAVDVGRAVSAGRRRIRARRAVAGATAALVVAGLVVGVTAVRGLMARPGGGAVQAAASTTGGPAEPASAPTSFDPMSRYASFGWLPEGLTHHRDRADGVAASYPPASSGDIASHGVELQLWPAGEEPHTAIPKASDAPPVNGAEAWWGEERSGSRTTGQADQGQVRWTYLFWRYAPNAWAMLTVHGLRGVDDPQPVAHRIASNVKFGEPRKITLPVETTGLPGGCRVPGNEIDHGPVFGVDGELLPWSVDLTCRDSKPDTAPNPYLEVHVFATNNRVGYDTRKIGRPNATVDGHPAFRTTMPDDSHGGVMATTLAVFDVNGQLVIIILRRDVAGGPEAVFRALKVRDGWKPA